MSHGIIPQENPQAVCVNTLSISLEKNLTEIKRRLPSEDILTYTFETGDQVTCAIVYADGIVNKELLGDLIARPLSKLCLRSETAPKNKNEGGRYALNMEIIQKSALFPELKKQTKIEDVCKEVLDGNSLLLIDGIGVGFIIGAKFIPVRAVSEPPTDVTVKGPREGFIEDVKTNMALVRKRLKTPNLRFESVRVGKNSDTIVTLCWLEGTSKEGIKEEIKAKLNTLQIDFIPDSSYIAAFLSPRRHSIFHTIGTTEKPDVFAAKISEGRVGVLVDGSPIALTAPYLLMEDLQSSEDYFISHLPRSSGDCATHRIVTACILRIRAAVQITTATAWINPHNREQHPRITPLTQPRNVCGTVPLRNLKRGQHPHAEIRRNVPFGGRGVGAWGNGGVGRFLIHTRHHRGRAVGHLPLYRTRFRGNGQPASVVIFARCG